jgi:hypothetical protein
LADRFLLTRNDSALMSVPAQRLFSFYNEPNSH